MLPVGPIVASYGLGLGFRVFRVMHAMGPCGAFKLQELRALRACVLRCGSRAMWF